MTHNGNPGTEPREAGAPETLDQVAEIIARYMLHVRRDNDPVDDASHERVILTIFEQRAWSFIRRALAAANPEA